MAKYQIFTDSCCDLTPEMRKAWDVEYFRMGLIKDGKALEATLDGDLYTLEEFYGWLKAGVKMTTTAITVDEFVAKARPVLAAGKDIIYIACSTALSTSVNTFNTLAREILEEEFPERKLIGIDSLTASATLGLLVYGAAKMRDKGLSIDELAAWVEEKKFFVNQWATVDTLTYLKAAGRVKAGAAFFGNIFGVKPLIISDRKGNNLSIEKCKGTKASLNRIVQGVVDTYIPDECFDIVFIGEGDNKDGAEYVKKQLEERIPGVKVVMTSIGPIVGNTCGPGVIATFNFGKEVTRYDGDGINQ